MPERVDRAILHADMDAFFTSVEQLDHPEFRGRPVVVGAPPDRRGVVAAASYEARRFGIHSAMPSREAGRRCPQAVFLPPRMARYQEISAQVFALFERFTPLVEPLSIDEAFLDVTGALPLFGPPEEIARRLRAAVREETGLTVSVGVASNKFLAKIASDMNKPDGLTIVPRMAAGILAFLAPLSAGRLWGVGKMTLAQLQRAGIHTIGDIQALSIEALASCVGRHQAAHLWRLAYGEDSREIELEREEKSLSRELTFPSDCRQRTKVTQALSALAEEVGEQLRAAGKYAGTAHLKVRWHSFKTITRQRPFETPCCDGASLREAALALWAAVPMEAPVRLIGFGVRRLSARPARQQMLLFERGAENPARREKVSRAVDAIRDQFGEASIRRAADLEQADPHDVGRGDGGATP